MGTKFNNGNDIYHLICGSHAVDMIILQWPTSLQYRLASNETAIG